jgi:Tfp pilus assembly protein PilX
MRDESGMAMIIALSALLIVGVLAAAALAISVQTNGSTRSDVNRKQAMEAAEAGLQVANYRLNMLAPASGQCVTTVVASPDSSGYCQGPTEALGNGATYSYVTSPVLAAGVSCVGLPLSNVQPISQRCITAVGISNGVTQRAQTRVAAFGGTPLFGPNAIIGLKSVSVYNNDIVNGQVATNGTLTLGSNATIRSYQLGPGGSLQLSNGASAGTGTQLTAAQGPIVLGPVQPGNSATTNSNYRITNYLNNPSNPTAPYDASSGVSFDPATRVLSMSNNASLTLGGGIYNFCSFTAANNVTITLAAGVKTEILIDSPDDPNSGCGANTGTLSIKNNANFINPSLDTTALQLYVYGRNDGSNVVTLSNNNSFYGVVYAPQSTINITNNGSFNGAIAGNVVNLVNNFTFNWDSQDQYLQATSTGLFYRTAWAACVPTPPASDLGSGCG